MQSIADRLIYLRSKNNLSQTELARQLGVTPVLISAYEKQERKPSVDKLVDLADVLHVSTDYILGRTYTTDSSVVLNIDGLSDKQIKLIRELVQELKNS